MASGLTAAADIAASGAVARDAGADRVIYR
jgi:hypothetical protein